MDNKLDLMVEYIRQKLLKAQGTNKTDLLISIYKEMKEEGYSNRDTYIMVNVAILRNMAELGKEYKRW